MAIYQSPLKQTHFMGAGLIATLMAFFTFAMQWSGPSANSTNANVNGSLLNGNQYAVDRVSQLENLVASLLNPSAAHTAAYNAGYFQPGYGAGAHTSLPASQVSYQAPNPYAQGYAANPNLVNTSSNAGYAANYRTNDVQVHFSPNGGCTQAIVAELRNARQQVLVQAYSFTSEEIAQALVAAQARGVQVFVILDRSESLPMNSAASYLAQNGVIVKIDEVEKIAHNKIMLIDNRVVITGSFNFSKAAEHENAENLLVIRDRPEIYQAYADNLKRHFEHSMPFRPQSTGYPASANSRIGTQAAGWR